MQNFVFNKEEFSVLLYQLNTLLDQQRHIKKTLLDYLEHISAYINNSNDAETTATITSELADVQNVFENNKNIIDKILELKLFLENVSNSSSSSSITFEKYYETQLDLEKQIYKNNDLYTDFINTAKSIVDIDLDFSIPKAIFLTEELKNKTNTEKDDVYFDESSSVDDTDAPIIENNKSYEEIVISNIDSILNSIPKNFDEIFEIPEINSTKKYKFTAFMEDTILEENNSNKECTDTEISTDNSAPFMEDTIIEKFEEEPSLLETSTIINNDSTDDLSSTETNFFDDIVEIPETIKIDTEEIEKIEDAEEIEETVKSDIEEIEKSNIEEIKETISEPVFSISEDSPAFMEDTIVEENLNEEPPIVFEPIETPVVSEVEEDTTLTEKTLFIQKYNNTAILPYSILDLEEYFSDNPAKYTSLQDIIIQEYTVSLDDFVNNSITRFKETYKLAKTKSNLSTIDALNFAKSILHLEDLQPVIIAACSSIDELTNYIECLKNKQLDNFEHFKIINK